MHQTGSADPASTPNLRALARLGHAPRTPTPRASAAPAVRAAACSPALRAPAACESARAPAHTRMPARARSPVSPAPNTPAPALARPAHLLRAQCRIVAAQPALSWPCVRAGMAVSWPASRHSAAQPLLTIQLYCIAIQIELASAAIHLSPLTVLQYSFLANYTCLAIQSFLQPCNTKIFSQYCLGSSPTQYFCTKFFFCFFIIINFFSFISRNWENP